MMSNIFDVEEIRQRKFLKRGHQLTILVVGESGTGKATFVNTLCNKEVVPVGRAAPEAGEIQMDTFSAVIAEYGTKFELDVVIARGFGDFIDNSGSTNKVVRYLEAQFDAELEEESKIQRTPGFEDSKVHAALYFIRSTGKGLRAIDVECMKSLAERCNVIPVISKSDLLTKDEKRLNKELIMRDIKEHGIDIYDPSSCFEDLSGSSVVFDLKHLVPFAVVCGTDVEQAGEAEYKVRRLPYGTVLVEDPEHSDFIILRTCLLGACLQDLKDITDDFYYETYRTSKLLEKSVKATPEDCGETHEEVSLDSGLVFEESDESIELCSLSSSAVVLMSTPSAAIPVTSSAG